MEKILVPTDFSPTAGAALRYAYFLAEATGLGVEVLHVHDGYGYSAFRRAKKGGLEARVNAQRKLDRFIRFNLKIVPAVATGGFTEPEVNVSSRGIIGSPTKALLIASRRADTCMIVMGGVGSGVADAATPLFGSITRRIAERAACPVLLVPEGYGTPVMKRAAIAFNWIGALRETSIGFDFLRVALGPAMHLVHVRDFMHVTKIREETALLEKILNTEFPGYPVQLDLPEPGVTAPRLLAYAHDKKIDLLVMGRRNRSLFERLFLRSEIGTVLKNGGTPMLVIPISHA
ncbi:universal stress protein [Neolewinella antarctica]|uniref:Nucleotide-binding universal stress UspA family protein n=1 Tax=Neolewinella antarctica TaxID=442734 RepID=A0ABX0X9J8_9BACT|nr:universal stress protein [Neolewinella antarctica]NJC25604.1 nucleotide-binding universal stress UspA family protein [Neolewinella antarctica]